MQLMKHETFLLSVLLGGEYEFNSCQKRSASGAPRFSRVAHYPGLRIAGVLKSPNNVASTSSKNGDS